MARKQGKSNETRTKNTVKKSGPMKQQFLHKRGVSKNGSKHDENFFIKPSQNFDIKHLSPEENSASTSSNTLLSKGKHNDMISSKAFSKKVKQNQDESTDVTNNKKPFDKKLFRLKKYSNKYKLQQWEEKRKKSALREYQQSFKNLNEPKLDVAKIYEDDLDLAESNIKLDAANVNNVNAECENLLKAKNKKPFLKPHERYQRMKEEKQKKIEEITKKKKEREEAIKRAQKQRMERNKKLKQKTKKGQPIMKYRIEMLLEKIEKSLKD